MAARSPSSGRRLPARYRRESMPADAVWYGVRVTVEIRVADDPPGKRTYEDRVVVVRASSDTVARRKAERLTRAAEETYRNFKGDKVKWRFREVVDVCWLLDDNMLRWRRGVFRVHELSLLPKPREQERDWPLAGVRESAPSSRSGEHHCQSGAGVARTTSAPIGRQVPRIRTALARRSSSPQATEDGPEAEAEEVRPGHPSRGEQSEGPQSACSCPTAVNVSRVTATAAPAAAFAREFLSRRADSNCRPAVYETAALPAELRRRGFPSDSRMFGP